MPDGEPRLENVLGQPVGLVRDTCDDDASGELEKVADSGPPQSEHDNPPYHVLTRKQKWPLVLLVAVAGIFSPMSANVGSANTSVITIAQLHADKTLLRSSFPQSQQ